MKYYIYNFDNRSTPIIIFASTITEADKRIKSIGLDSNKSIVSNIVIDLIDYSKHKEVEIHALDKITDESGDFKFIPSSEVCEVIDRGIVTVSQVIQYQYQMNEFVNKEHKHYDKVCVRSGNIVLFNTLDVTMVPGVLSTMFS